MSNLNCDTVDQGGDLNIEAVRVRTNEAAA